MKNKFKQILILIKSKNKTLVSFIKKKIIFFQIK